MDSPTSPMSNLTGFDLSSVKATLDLLDKAYILSDSKMIFYISERACSLLGVREEDVQGKRALSFAKNLVKEGGETLEVAAHPYIKILETHLPINNYILGVYKNAVNLLWLSTSSIILPEASPNPVVLTLFEDITKLKHIQTEITMYKEAISSVSYAVMIAGSDGTILFANQASEKASGYSAEEILGKKLMDAPQWGSQMSYDFYLEMWNKVKVKKEIFESEVENKSRSGKPYTTLLHVAPVLDVKKEVSYFVSIEVDISSYKETQKTQNLLATFFDVSVDMLCIANSGGRFERINKSFEEILGWSIEELMSNSLLEYVHKDDLQNTYEMMGNLFTHTHVVNFENRYRCKDGTYKWLSWNIKSLDDGRMFATIRDITDIKEIDKAKTEFISMASHQLRTPLSAVRWYSEMLNSHVYRKLDVKEQKYLMHIQNANLRMIKLVGTLLNISRIESGRLIVEPIELDLKELIQSLVEELILRSRAKKQTIIIDYRAEHTKFSLDETIIRNILMNLVNNALKYSPEGKNVTISVEENGALLKLSVMDEGYGIPNDDKTKVFTKFFRSSNIVELETEGSGLGLYLVKQLVDISGGQISFDSQETKGTTFNVVYPLTGMTARAGVVSFGS